ncbi:MAG: PHP domain-containing protein [Candidatus Bipolaricaulota bacterium]
MPAERYADLHLHTRWSDGTLYLKEAVRRAHSAGYDCVAITDHDTIGPELTTPIQVLEGAEVITGVEIKADILGHRGEVLAYFVDPFSPKLRELIDHIAQARIERMKEMISLCNLSLGLRLDYESVAHLTDGSVGRPHLAAALVEAGAARSNEEAFQRFLSRGAPCYVPLPRPGFPEVVSAVRAAGGVAALAHPAFLPIEDWQASLAELQDMGMDGLEVYYPYETGRAPLYISSAELAAFAEALGLIPTGGSDDHGPDSVNDSLGSVRVPYGVVERLAGAASSVT